MLRTCFPLPPGEAGCSFPMASECPGFVLGFSHSISFNHGKHPLRQSLI